MIANLESIKQLLNTSAISRYRIAKESGVSAPTLQKYASGKSKIENMSLINAIRLTKCYENHKGEIEMEKVEFEGKTYTLTQEAYITESGGVTCYEASGIDEDGNDVTVTWDIKDVWLDEDGQLNGLLEDGGEACDWNNPVSVE